MELSQIIENKVRDAFLEEISLHLKEREREREKEKTNQLKNTSFD